MGASIATKGERGVLLFEPTYTLATDDTVEKLQPIASRLPNVLISVVDVTVQASKSQDCAVFSLSFATRVKRAEEFFIALGRERIATGRSLNPQTSVAITQHVSTSCAAIVSYPSRFFIHAHRRDRVDELLLLRPEFQSAIVNGLNETLLGHYERYEVARTKWVEHVGWQPTSYSASIEDARISALEKIDEVRSSATTGPLVAVPILERAPPQSKPEPVRDGAPDRSVRR